MPLPTISLCGTPRHMLVSMRLDPHTSITESIRILRENAPNQRDYPGDSWAAAVDVFNARVNALMDIADDLLAEAMEIQG